MRRSRHFWLLASLQARHALPGGRFTLFDSFHCSRYNTNTGRLTRAMFRDVFRAASAHLGRPPGPR